MGVQASGTGIVAYDSELVRKGWVLKGLVQAKSTSFWDGLTGMSEDAVIYQKNDFAVKEGHEVHFQMDGNLVGSAHVDKEQAWGNSEQKKLFSDSLRVKRLRWSVDNGDKFDAKNVGDLSLAEHGDSRSKLSDLFIRAKDQMIFDAGLGLLHNEAPTHTYLPNLKANIGALVAADVFTYGFAMDLEDVIKSGRGYTSGGTRRPLEPYKLADGRKVWLMVVDSRQSRDIRKDNDFIGIAAQADVRGENNILLKGVIGTLGAFVIIEAQSAFGTASAELGKSSVEICGLRKVDSAGLFEGQPGFGAGGTVVASRGLILGRGAFQVGFGKQPDYKFKSSQDFDIKSESALEVWMNVQKTILNTENIDYVDAKVAGHDYGVVVFDTFYELKA
ncbi:MAG: hypothetical protein DRQ78_09570 [Epsilonproteobacteria bacterium]|nr:MAG: hypothetical protein DRQ78_09570 [Campylobacterota bacterium]